MDEENEIIELVNNQQRPRLSAWATALLTLLIVALLFGLTFWAATLPGLH